MKTSFHVLVKVTTGDNPPEQRHYFVYDAVNESDALRIVRNTIHVNTLSQEKYQYTVKLVEQLATLEQDDIVFAL